MDLKTGLKSQFGGALAMLRRCVEECPDEVWLSGTHPRTYWRVAYHAAFYADLYLRQSEAEFSRWELHRQDAASLWGTPPEVPPYTQAELIGYIDGIVAGLGATIDRLDLETDDCGFDWYPGYAKTEHVLLCLRHLQGHVGMLEDRLLAAGVETKWIGKA
jgi:hypothetical protein